MDHTESALAGCRLFAGIRPGELNQMLSCLDSVETSYAAGATILFAGDRSRRVGVLLSGRAEILREELSGARTLVAALLPGELFGEGFACASPQAAAPQLRVQADLPCRVLWLAFERIITTCSSGCAFHTRLIANMMAVLADKNLLLNRRIGHLSKRTTREKLLSYLSEQQSLCGASSFVIPFNRQELADYLCVERSAMSAALCRLRDEGLISFSRSRFELHADFKDHI